MGWQDRIASAQRRRLLASLALAPAVGLVGCVPARSEQSPEASAPAGPVRWPAPPAPARFVHAATLRTSLDVRQATSTDTLRALLGAGDVEDVRFEKPYGVAAAAGMVYVTDTVMRRVHAFDVPRRRFFLFGYRREGTLQKPLGLCVDAREHVYVADVTARRVVVYDRYGLYQRGIGDPDSLSRPTDVATDAPGERVYVVDLGGVESDRHRVVVYDRGGRLLRTIGRRGAGPGEFNLPVAAAVAADGTLYVLDAGNFRVQAFSPEGTFLRTFGSIGRSFGQFARPKSIATDAAGRIYVADAAFGNVQVFDANGRLLLPVGEVSRVDRPGRYGLLSGVAVDERGFVYVLDQSFRKVDVIRPAVAA